MHNKGIILIQNSELTQYLSFDGEKFGRAGSTKVSHKETLGLANYKGSALTTGCSTGGSCGIRTESMDMTTLKWSDEADFPYGG